MLVMKVIEKLSNIRINKVFSFTNNFTNTSHKGFRKNRENSALVIKYEGETYYINKGKKIFSNNEHIVLLPKGCSYKWECIKKGHFLSIEFDSDFICDQIISIKYPHYEKILKYFLAYNHDLVVNYDAKELLKVKYAYDVLCEIINYINSDLYYDKNTKNSIMSVLEYINMNYHERFTNEKLASKTKYGTSYFRKLFTEIVGISPLQYVTKVKMEKAKELLYSDINKISEIAELLGFENVYYFSNAFKKYYGLSPIKYTKKDYKESS